MLYTIQVKTIILNTTFQGFSTTDLTPMEAAQVLCRCEHRIGHRIPEEDIRNGDLRKWLSSEDYRFSIDKVSIRSFIT